MVTIFETELLPEKKINLALTKIYGINNSMANNICKKLGLLPNLKTKHTSHDQINKILLLIESMRLIVGNDLKKFKFINFNKIVLTKSYKGLRKLEGLPIRGQRTHSNAKTTKRVNKKS